MIKQIFTKFETKLSALLVKATGLCKVCDDLSFKLNCPKLNLSLVKKLVYFLMIHTRSYCKKLL